MIEGRGPPRSKKGRGAREEEKNGEGCPRGGGGLHGFALQERALTRGELLSVGGGQRVGEGNIKIHRGGKEVFGGLLGSEISVPGEKKRGEKDP